MLRTSWMKDLFVLFICLFSVYFSIPSFFPDVLKSESRDFFAGHKINLGLDLRGGAYLLLEVDVQSYEREQFQKIADGVKSQLSSSKTEFSNFHSGEKELSVKLASPETAKAFGKEINSYFGGAVDVMLNDDALHILMNEKAVITQKRDLMSQTMEIVRRRIDEDGTKEVDIQVQGDSYILVQVPGLENPDEIKRMLGKTAKLSFHLVDERVSMEDARHGHVPFGVKVLMMDGDKEGERHVMPLQARPIVTGDMLESASATLGEGRPVVSFRFNTFGAKIFGEATTANSGRLMAIVLDNKIISAPVIREPIITGSGVISGNFSMQSANELALLLRAGALPVPLKVAEERTVGPSLGLDSIQAGTKAAIIGTTFVLVFMLLFYGVFGVIANIALIFNLVIMIAVLGLFGATLTMPGIAGIVLTLGMAVDSNVLIFERIREEVRKGRTVLSSIESGYSLAFATIFDSNITTILAAVILIIFGTGPVKGFAITLSVGILCSMFTSVTLSKVITAHWYRKFKPSKLPL